MMLAPRLSFILTSTNFQIVALLVAFGSLSSTINYSTAEEETTTIQALTSQAVTSGAAITDPQLNANNKNGQSKRVLKGTFVSTFEKLAKALLKTFLEKNETTVVDNNSDDTGRASSGKAIADIVIVPVRSGFGQVMNLIGDKIKAIYPGTAWCGAGNIAKHKEELGLFNKTDSCCRAHDLCTNSIDSGKSLDGLLNDGIFTRSGCSCDKAFYECLKRAKSPIATNIGITYFNVLRPQCFKEDFPATCVKYGRNRLIKNKCTEYETDHTKNKTLQWFDNPDF